MSQFRVSRPAAPRNIPRLMLAVLLSATFFALVPGFTDAATIRVPADHPSIQAAINAASSGDEILVSPGTYLENLNFFGKQLSLRGELGAASTIIDGQQMNRVVTVSGGGGLIEGLTIRNGVATLGGGIYVAEGAQVTIQDCTIEDNLALPFDQGSGGGIYLRLDNGGCLIRRNVIRNNYAGDSGGGVYDGSAVTVTAIEDNRFEGNGCHVGGGAVRLAVTTFSRNLVLRNWSDNFGGGVLGGGLLIEGNTIVSNFNNNSFVHGAGIRVLTTVAVIRNNIVAFNYGAAGAMSGAGIQSLATVECNDSWGNMGPDFLVADTTGRGNFSLDPLFCAPSGDDFSIGADSPCNQVSGGCGLLGAFPAACGVTATSKVTWGRLKTIYH